MNIYIKLLMIFALLSSCNYKQDKSPDSIIDSKEDKANESNQALLSNQFDKELENFVDKHSNLPVERLYVAYFQQINNETHILISSDINVPEVVEGSEQVRGILDKGKFKLIIIDEEKSNGYGLYNPNLLKGTQDINFKDDSYSAPYLSEYKIESDSLILISEQDLLR